MPTGHFVSKPRRIAGEDPYRAATMLLVAAKLRVYRFEAAAALEEVEEALALISVDEHNLLHLGALSMARVMAATRMPKRPCCRQWRQPSPRPTGIPTLWGSAGPWCGWKSTNGPGHSSPDRYPSRGKADTWPTCPKLSCPWQSSISAPGGGTRHGKQPQKPSSCSTRVNNPPRPPSPRVCSPGSRPARAMRTQPAVTPASPRRAMSEPGCGAATAYAEAALGMLELGLGRPAKATAYLGRALTILREGAIGQPWLLPIEADLAEAHARNGNPSEARLLAEDIIDRGKGAGSRSAVAAGLRSLGLVADDGSFSRIFEEALLIHGSMPVPFETARTELCFGERLRRTRQRVDSRVRLRRALDIFESLGAAPWASRAEAELSATGETLQRNATPVRLTPQERQVACVVASGATNREAAAELFVSSKTIEFHLGNVYRKLGVRSRTELANALAGDRLPQVDQGRSAT